MAHTFQEFPKNFLAQVGQWTGHFDGLQSAISKQFKKFVFFTGIRGII